jgi:hypothetical protein
VDEDIRGALAPGQKAETAQPVEPLHLGSLEPAGGGDGDMGARRRHLRRVHGGRFVHGKNAERLQAARPLQHLDHDARALIRDLEAVATSNHLMTPVSSMTLAASSPISPPVLRSTPKPPPLVPSDVMTPQRRRFVPALLTCASNLSLLEDYHSAAFGKVLNASHRRKRWMACEHLDDVRINGR